MLGQSPPPADFFAAEDGYHGHGASVGQPPPPTLPKPPPSPDISQPLVTHFGADPAPSGPSSPLKEDLPGMVRLLGQPMNMSQMGGDNFPLLVAACRAPSSGEGVLGRAVRGTSWRRRRGLRGRRRRWHCCGMRRCSAPPPTGPSSCDAAGGRLVAPAITSHNGPPQAGHGGGFICQPDRCEHDHRLCVVVQKFHMIPSQFGKLWPSEKRHNEGKTHVVHIEGK